MAAKAQGTWQVLEPMGVAALTNVDTTAAYPFGYRCKARDGGATDYGHAEFMYVKGGTSLAVGSVVSIAGDYTTTLIAARAIGAVGLAISVLDAATKYGWVQIRGRGVAKCDSSVTAGAPLYIDGTAGRIDDTAVAGDAVLGMLAYSTDDTNTCVVNLLSNCTVGDFDNA